MFELADYQLAAQAIREQTQHQPTIGLVLGSGLNKLAQEVESADFISCATIPHWPKSTVEGHVGQLVIGRLGGQTVLVQQGRVHSYEGYDIQWTTFPIRVMSLLGIKTIILTNAAGGLDPQFQAGELMLITDHINWAGMAGLNPLKGKNIDAFGPRFPDMTFPYHPAFCEIARTVAQEQGITLREGVYVFLSGPNFESSAEIRMLYQLGGSAVGMSTVPEVIVARHAGMRVLAISSITNVAPHHPKPDHLTTHEEVIETGNRIVPQLSALLLGVLPLIES